MIGCLPTQALAFEWKPGLMLHRLCRTPAAAAAAAAADDDEDD